MNARLFVPLAAAIAMSPFVAPGTPSSASGASATPSPPARYTFDPPRGFVRHADVGDHVRRWVRPHAAGPAYDEIMAAGEQPHTDLRTLDDFRRFARERLVPPSDVFSDETMGKTCHNAVPAYFVTITGQSPQSTTFESRFVLISKDPWVFIASYARLKTLAADAEALASLATLCPVAGA